MSNSFESHNYSGYKLNTLTGIAVTIAINTIAALMIAGVKGDLQELENIEEKLLNKWKAYYYSCIKRDIEQTNLLRQVLYALSSTIS